MQASFSTEHINYLQRNFLDVQIAGDASILFKGIRNYADVRLLHIQGMSRFWSGNEHKALAIRQFMADIFAGLHAEQVPIVFMVLGTLNRINVFFGSYRDNEDWSWPLSRGGVNGDLQTITGSLQSAFPGIFLRECDDSDWDNAYSVMRHAPGFSLIAGTPTAKLGTEQMGVEQIERLIRGMYGRHWGYLVVAKPFPLQTAVDLYNEALNELREVTNAQDATSGSPIAEAYADLLRRYLDRHGTGKTSGLWRVVPYCFGADPLSYLRVRAVSQAVFGGEDSLPDPLRVIHCVGYSREIAHLGQIVLPCQQPAPGRITHKYQYASVLNSAELATLAHLPQEEMPGYEIKDYARFDVSPPKPDATQPGKPLAIGEIVDRQQPTGNNYAVNLSDLAKHSIIVGVTGSGKTNTAFHLLKGAWKSGIPFLVIEPAKAEYRQLLDGNKHPEVDEALRVFTLGDERISPFRLNPFQVLSGVPVQTHIDHLKAVFNASFAMYGPMPQVLEQCIYAIYEDRGWDMATGQNHRGDHPLAYPTLTDLYHKVDEVVEGLGYGPRITPELRAALKVRVNSLRIGGKGLMLDTPLSIPIQILLEQPTVLELQAVGDDDEKAFIMGLVWVFLYEYYRANSPLDDSDNQLKHLTLIEEAHRLLTAVPVTTNPEVANTRGKAVETFSHMLSEIRAYGEGMLIADQIPARLAPDVIKNTSLKIMHRLVSDEDRLLMGGTMNLDQNQLRYIATLGRGNAAVYAEGDDGASLVQVPLSKERKVLSLTVDTDVPDLQLLDSEIADEIQFIEDVDAHIEVLSESKPEVEIGEDEESLVEYIAEPTISITPDEVLPGSDQRIRDHMSNFSRQETLRDVFWPPLTVCPSCSGPCEHRALARRLATEAEVQNAFTRYVLSCVHWTNYLRQGLITVREKILRFAPQGSTDAALLTLTLRLLVDNYFRRLGDAYQWPYVEVQKVQRLFMTAMEKVASDEYGLVTIIDDEIDFGEFQQQYRELCRRLFDPYPECSQVCNHGLCLYRFHLVPFTRQPWLQRRYTNAFTQVRPETSASGIEESLRGTGRAAVRSILTEEVPERAKQRAAACFLIQKAYTWAEADAEQQTRAAQLGTKAALDESVSVETP